VGKWITEKTGERKGVAMSRYSRPAWLLASLLAGAVFSIATFQGLAGPKHSAASDAVYDSEPAHLWNRVHAAFYTRIGPDDRPHGTDRLEPLLWSNSEYLLQGKSADRAVAVLEEFLREKGELLLVTVPEVGVCCGEVS
jgi:hypothetical protein